LKAFVLTAMKKPFLVSKTVFLALFFIAISNFDTIASGSTEDGHETKPEEFSISEVILDHVMDSHEWHFTESFVIPLPIIVYSEEKGLDIFSSANFFEHHQPVVYKGYKLEKNHISLTDSGKPVLDLSITKNVVMLLINVGILLFVFLSVAKAYKAHPGKAPRGLQSMVEPIIVFVRDEIVKPNISHHHEKYLPYLLTLFFVVLFGNLLGLLPGLGNLTGNIAFTLFLALITFFITNFSGNKNYWSHIFWTPGVPMLLRPIILPVEIIGIFTKPFSLTIRLFVAITAGHIVLLSLICLTFIFHSYFVGIGASLVVVFINMIELLVAGIQAYVFTLFTSLYIGMATAEDHH
jgi:F-type H+-transporting ATPase subunit a